MRLQVALDLINLEEALRIAKKVVEAGAHILEVGTPLIKFHGVSAIQSFRREFPKMIIVADMKTIDTGTLEAEIAFQAGADIVTVLGVASDQTIRDVVRIAQEYGGEVMADLMRVPDKSKRARELELMGVNYVLVHTGIDEQLAGRSPLEDLSAVESTVAIPLAVAGGINEKNIEELKRHRIEIVIVGRYITKAPNPKKATQVLLSKMRR